MTGSGPVLGEDRPHPVVWCAKSREGWCAVVPNTEPAEGSWWVNTLCGFGITLPWGYDRREPDCPDCLAVPPCSTCGAQAPEPHYPCDEGCDGPPCDCPKPTVCADCCTDPGCPLARQIPGQLTIDEAT